MALSKDLSHHCQPPNWDPLQLKEQLTELVNIIFFFFHEKTSESSECYQSGSFGFKLLVKQKALVSCFVFTFSAFMSLSTNGF